MPRRCNFLKIIHAILANIPSIRWLMKIYMRFFPVFLMVMLVSGFTAGVVDAKNAKEEVDDTKVSYDSVPLTQPFVAITFDDGPSQMLTPVVLKILADRNIKATFFAVGESAQSHPDVIKAEVMAGHEIGSRAWSHSGFSKSSDASWHSDMARTDQAIKLAAGRSPRLFCPFDKDFSEQECDQMNKDFGYKVIFWNLDSLAVKSQGAAAIVQTIVSQVKPGSIIMSSDIDSTSVQALPTVLDALISKGYKFVTVPQLIALASPAGMSRYLAANPDAAPKPTASAANPHTSSTTTEKPSTSAGGFHPFGEATPPSGAPVPNNGTDGQ